VIGHHKIIIFDKRLAMPKLYEYFGLIFLFYSQEHEPIHVHGKFQEKKVKLKLFLRMVNSERL